MKKVFILHHIYELPSLEEDVKLIGIYSSRHDAERAIERAKLRQGFADHPDGFEIGEYVLGEDHWIDGFTTWIPE